MKFYEDDLIEPRTIINFSALKWHLMIIIVWNVNHLCLLRIFDQWIDVHFMKRDISIKRFLSIQTLLIIGFKQTFYLAASLTALLSCVVLIDAEFSALK